MGFCAAHSGLASSGKAASLRHTSGSIFSSSVTHELQAHCGTYRLKKEPIACCIVAAVFVSFSLLLLFLLGGLIVLCFVVFWCSFFVPLVVLLFILLLVA